MTHATSFHKLGTRVNGARSWQEAMHMARLDWTVTKRDLFARQPVSKAVFQLPDIKGIFREDNGVYLGSVGKDFGLVQPSHAFTWTDDVLGTTRAQWDTAGFSGNGERIWACAKLPESFQVAGTDDRTDFYLMFATAFDGSMSTIADILANRLVCSNGARVLGTLRSLLRVRHTINSAARIELAKAGAREALRAIQTYGETMNTLARRRMTRENMMAVMNRMFPAPADGERSARTDNIAKAVLELFASNDRNAVPEIRGTALNLFNAFTEYTDHHRSARITEGRAGMSVEQARAENALFGTGDKFKQDALLAVIEETEGAPVHEYQPASRVQSDADFLRSMRISLD